MNLGKKERLEVAKKATSFRLMHKFTHNYILISGNVESTVAAQKAMMELSMSMPDEETVRRVLSVNDRGTACRRAVEEAWKTVKEGYPEKVSWRRKSTRAALMWEHSVNNVVDALDGDKGVHVVSHHDTISFVFDETVFLRFKKASIDLQTNNYPTLLALFFHQHEEDLFGYEGLHRVEIAHVLNRFETDLDWVGVVARQKRQVLWHFELDSGGAAIERLPLPLPLPMPISPAGERVLRPTKPVVEETREDEKE
ncbi:MAG: hypothetical protein CVT81_08165 [Alphaproteobacteria bacterium HGW-Alphaproteobacteria-3]|nr:MAG: hypothetical protein CVT81_08165 [Alphaproteobacteria bacterium HGW-Alphaproteobacteria-3]